MKNTIIIIGMALLMVGVVMAISASSFNWISDARWSGVSAGNDTTEGGNITRGDLGSVSLTEKWAAYWGNVSGSIRLWDGNASVYIWAVSNASAAGEVCASTNSAFSFASAGAGDGVDVDSTWGFTSGDTDSATNTLQNADCSLTFSGVGTISGSDNADHANSAFETCVINVTGGTEDNFAFCTVINSSGLAYNGVPAQYELMVPTTETAGALETFFFYLELN